MCSATRAVFVRFASSCDRRRDRRIALRRGVATDLVPEEYVAEALVSAFPRPRWARKGPSPTRRRVTPRGTSFLRDCANSGGTSMSSRRTERCRRRFLLTRSNTLRSADVVTFTSSSTVLGFLENGVVSDLPPVVASIGPITTAAAKMPESRCRRSGRAHLGWPYRLAGGVRRERVVLTELSPRQP